MILNGGKHIGLPATFAARLVAAGGGSLLAIIVARQGGPGILGQLALFTSLLGTVGILARRGLDVILIRAVADATLHNLAGRQFAIFLFALKMCVVPTGGLAVVGAGLLASGFLGNALSGSAPAFIFALPMFTGLALASGYVKGAGRPWLAPLFEIGGISFVACLLLLPEFITQMPVTGAEVLAALMASMGFVSLTACILLRRSSRATQTALLRTTPVKANWSGQWEFTVIALSAFMLQAGSFTIAAPFLSETQLGLLRASERLAVVVSFPVLAINPVISARIVHHLVNAENRALRQMMRRAMITGACISALPFIAFVTAPRFCLTLLGSRFVDAAPYLQVMAVANFAISLFGPAAMAVNMAGLERKAMVVNVGCLGAGLVLFPLLTIWWGPNGFAAAYALIAILRSGIIFWLARSVGKYPVMGHRESC